LQNEIKKPRSITYEQPLNEHIRVCLRLENLFIQLNDRIMEPAIDSSKTSLTAILRTLDVINRPDLKSKLTQALTQHTTSLEKLEKFPEVDSKRLREILLQINLLMNSLHQNRSRIGGRLHSNEFLNQVRLSLGNPGGACPSTNPAFALWLRKPDHERIKDLTMWADDLNELREIINLILHLTRGGSNAQTFTAKDGFYHQALDPSIPCDLLRVTVPTAMNIFPEFSVGRHRLTIRFLTPQFQEHGRPEHLRENIDFDLACCRS